MNKRLWAVEVTKLIYVVAETRLEAERAAIRHVNDEHVDPEVSASSMPHLHVEDGDLDCVPWQAGGRSEFTVGQWLQWQGRAVKL